ASDNLDYNILPDQNFIVLNELKSIPNPLGTALRAFVAGGGSVFVIPANGAVVSTYNNLFTAFGLGTFSTEVEQAKNITQISFDHPLYAHVFEKRVVNFEYPKVDRFYPITGNAGVALRFGDGKPFVLQKGNVFVGTAALNTENSNFKSSPLIVPTLYNMAVQGLPLPKLYYENGRQNRFAVPVTLLQDQIITLRDSTQGIIPLQQAKAKQVLVTTQERPEKAGVYTLQQDERPLGLASYNYPRAESDLQYADPGEWGGATVHDSIQSVFEAMARDSAVHSFWKWFVILALLFLLFEMLALKFYKP
ncbi:MAG: hypothetical protein ACPGQR_03330, partial [Marinirhabdus sp.]